MRIITFLIKAVVLIAVLIGLTFVFARFHDGPIALIPGGALRGGELVETPVSDWAFAKDIETIEMQLEGDDTSRTVWVLVHNGRAYIPCSLGFPPGKNWHLRADADGAAIVRIAGRRYPVTLKRLVDSPVEDELESIVGTKYGGAPGRDTGAWFFSIRSRRP